MTADVATIQPTLAIDDAARKLWDAIVIGAGPAGAVAAYTQYDDRKGYWRMYAGGGTDLIAQGEDPTGDMTAEQRSQFITELEERMRDAAKKFDFEKAAQLRDKIKSLKLTAA